MNPRALLGVLALAALGVGLALVPDTKDTTPTKPADVLLELKGEEKLARADDGGIAYLRPVRQKDGGSGVIIATVPSCSRRPVGNKTCRSLDGGDPGDLNRWDATVLTGSGCQPVACSLYLERLPDGGDPANEEEAAQLTKGAAAGGAK